MKKSALVFSLFLFVAFTACNSEEKKPGNVASTSKVQADSLFDEVDKEHIIAMKKWMKMPDLQKEVEHLVDSIDKLPAKVKEAAAPYKTELQSANKQLQDAYTSMDNWMEAFGQRLTELKNNDSLKNNFEKQIKYYSEERIKIGKIKEDVLESVEKAESLIKAKS